MENIPLLAICIRIIVAIFISITSSAFGQDIHDAAWDGNLDKVKLILSKTPKLANIKDNDDWTPLHTAVFAGHVKIVEYLLKNGAYVNVKNNEDITPFFYAISRNHKKIAKLLISHGVRIPIKGEEAKNLLNIAVSNGNKELVDIMLAKNMNIYIKNKNGGTLLHSAVTGDSLDLISMFIKRGIDINKRNHYGLTPLHLAASNGNIEIIKLLLANDATLNAKSQLGRTPLQFAAEHAHNNVVEYLLSKGADNTLNALPVFKGKYLGQKTPGLKAELFAPEIISSIYPEHGLAEFSKNGNEAYWPRRLNRKHSPIYFMTMEKKQWTNPRILPFSSKYVNINPALTTDGKKLYFSSNRPVIKNKGTDGFNIWFIEKNNQRWSEPLLLKPPVNSSAYDGGPFIAKDGTLYFISSREGGKGSVDIYFSKWEHNHYSRPENIGSPINSEYFDAYPYISPDERYLIFESWRPGGFGGGDLYICFKKDDNTWSKAINMGNNINSSARETFPRVSHDGRFFFFSSDRKGGLDIFWINSNIIDRLRPSSKANK